MRWQIICSKKQNKKSFGRGGKINSLMVTFCSYLNLIYDTIPLILIKRNLSVFQQQERLINPAKFNPTKPSGP
jgi:hypothetical protein